MEFLGVILVSGRLYYTIPYIYIVASNLGCERVP